MNKRNADELDHDIETLNHQVTHLYTTLTSLDNNTKSQNHYDCILEAITHDSNNGVHPSSLIRVAFEWSIEKFDNRKSHCAFNRAFSTRFATHHDNLLIWYLQEFSRLEQHGKSVVVMHWSWYMDELTTKMLKQNMVNAEFFNHLCNLGLLEAYSGSQRGRFVVSCGYCDILKLDKESRMMIRCLLDAPREVSQFSFWRHGGRCVSALVGPVNVVPFMTYDEFINQFAGMPNIKNRSKFCDVGFAFQ